MPSVDWNKKLKNAAESFLVDAVQRYNNCAEDIQYSVTRLDRKSPIIQFRLRLSFHPNNQFLKTGFQ